MTCKIGNNDAETCPFRVAICEKNHEPATSEIQMITALALALMPGRGVAPLISLRAADSTLETTDACAIPSATMLTETSFERR